MKIISLESSRANNLLAESKNIKELKPNDLKADLRAEDLARNLLLNLQALENDDLALALEALDRRLTSEMSLRT